MAGKRAATSELNHENWDREEESEQAGIFQRASEDALKARVIKTAKRRIASNPSEGEKSSVFNPSVLNSLAAKPKPKNPFGFLSKIQTDAKVNGDLKSENRETLTEDSDEKKALNFKFGSPEKKTDNSLDLNKSKPMFSFGIKNIEKSKDEVEKPSDNSSLSIPQFKFGNQTDNKIGNGTVLSSKTNFNFGSIANENKNELDDSFYYGKLKGLNESVAKWISKHVEDNPLIDLKPIFKDYERFFDEIEKSKKTNTIKTDTKQNVNSEKTNAAPVFSFGIPASNANSSDNKKNVKDKSVDDSLIPTPVTSFKFDSTLNTNNFSLKNPFTSPSSGFTFGSSQPIKFGSVENSVPAKNNEENKEDEDEPPKVEVKEVNEEGHVYTKKCKMFIKKDNSFTEKGVGSLFLKPVESSEKMQLIIRAHNSLANILCNIILTKSIPTQRMGKNNVMLVCIPTPDANPPPVPVLIRVKNAEEADELLETLDKYKK